MYEYDIDTTPADLMQRQFFQVSVYEVLTDGSRLMVDQRNFLLRDRAVAWGDETCKVWNSHHVPMHLPKPEVIDALLEPPMSRQQLVDGLVEILEDVRSWQ